MNNVKILISTHKEVKLPQHDFFLPVHAGAALSDNKLPYQPDNTGENISGKNRNYCELTVHYWAWKNLIDADIIGLNHYRRYFDFNCSFSRFAPDRKFIAVDDFLGHSYQFPDFDDIFSKYDIILPNTRNYPYSMSTQYAVYHIVDDWNILKEVIRELSPDYLSAFEKTMERCNYSSNYNMFITRREYFEEYSEWLFKILFAVERRCKISDYPVQARIFGYMSERLINVYAAYKNLRVKHVPILVPIDEFKPWHNPSILKYNWWKLRNTLAYKISQL